MSTMRNVISKETIKPSSPTPPHLKTYKLSFLDQMINKVHMPLVFFYPYGSGNCQSLKKSLSQTLSEYHPFSGRFNAEKGSYVDCNDEGVKFVEAQIDATLSDQLITNSLNNYNQPFDHLFPGNQVYGGRPIYKDSSSDHLVIVQLSYFSCGGVALAVSMSHKMADASTFVSFVNHWATVTRRNSGDEQAIPLSPHFIKSQQNDANSNVDIIPKQDPEKGKGNNLVTNKFVFPNSKLAKLKEEDPTSTRNEVVSSLLYGCAVRAAKKVNSQLYVNDDTTFVMVQMVNLRKRMVEPLPETAVGNIWSFFMIPTVTESELALSHLTARIKKEKMQLTQLTGSLVISKRLATSANISASDEIYAFSSLCGFPLYEVDFGWGKPVRVNVMDWFLGKNLFVLMDTPSGDGIEVVLTLEVENMLAFQNDEQLLAFAF